MDQEEIDEFGKEIIRMIETKDMLPGEIFGMLENIRFSFTAATIKSYMEHEYGLVRVKK
ncbi:unnamed protein product [marine sediment metagenome]|uniref:Uncharacterized protein n=1 Tax=marine sediment metagenome TaxID=412755 RepID=X1J6G8_9ZZZZ